MFALALYDYVNESHENHQQLLLSFRRGTILDVMQSNEGWSYGRVVQKPVDEVTSTNSNGYSTGWFPTTYISLYESPLLPTSISIDNTVNKPISSNFSTAIAPDTTATSEDDKGFYGTPMGGYIDPEGEISNNNTARSSGNDDRDDEILPPGVAIVPVPTRRQLRVITIPKNLVSNIATTTSKLTNRLHQRQNHSSSTTRPAVFVSPS
jgi:hypothetical protein